MSKKKKKEEIAEDYCFVCKDGGYLMLCEHKDCLKAYHSHCVGKDDSFLEKDDRWTCNWHSCFFCHKTSKFHCFCCPKAVCGRCICDAEFAVVRGDEGFCNNCLKIAILIEENKDVDSEGGKVDFKNRDTYECLFMEYWEIVKEKESLTSEHVHFANNLLKKGKNYRCWLDSSRISEEEEDLGKSEEESHFILSDYDDSNDMKEHKPKHKRKKPKKKSYLTKRNVKSKGKEFIGWGSKPLLEFLASIGEETTEKLSQFDVTTIITRYCENNKLFHSEKKKKVLCDARLQSLLSRKSVNRNKIYHLLEAHFAENMELSEVDEVGYISEDENANVLVTCKRQRKPSSEGKLQKKEVVMDEQRSSFASIVAKNINLVYLKRSLMEELLKQPETFEGKVIGSFVRVKSDPNDILQKNSHQLMQVTGIKKTSSTDEINSEILLQLVYQKVPIQKLSDDDFSEEECEDLRQRMKGGLLKMPTVVELEQKARSLHEDVTKHRIERELAVLQSLIDQANEKGWRRERAEYADRKRLLQTPLEQMRLLKELPEIVVDAAEPETSGNSCNLNGRTDAEGSISDAAGVKQDQPMHTEQETVKKRSAFDLGDDDEQELRVSNGKQALEHPDGERVKQDQPMHTEQEMVKKRSAFDLSDDDEQDVRVSNGKQALENPDGESIWDCVNPDDEQDMRVSNGKQALENPDGESIWHCVSPSGKRLGPYSMSLLKRWRDSSNYDLNFKVWKTGQSQEKAVLLTDALHQLYPKREKQDQPMHTEQETVKKRSAFDLSDDDEQDMRVSNGKQALENQDGESIWHCVSPSGKRVGPYPMPLLKRWRNSSDYDLDFKVWKKGQSQEEAVLLTDALHKLYPKE